MFIIYGEDSLHTTLQMLCRTKGSWKRAAVYLGGGQPNSVFTFVIGDHSKDLTGGFMTN